MEFGWCDSSDNSERNGVGFMVLSELFATQNTFLFGMILFDKSLVSFNNKASDRL